TAQLDQAAQLWQQVSTQTVDPTQWSSTAAQQTIAIWNQSLGTMLSEMSNAYTTLATAIQTVIGDQSGGLTKAVNDAQTSFDAIDKVLNDPQTGLMVTLNNAQNNLTA